VEAFSVENFSDGEQSAPLNGNPIQQAYCAPDKMTVFSRLSRFGMTYKPLTENLGEELLTLYLAGFHAKTSAPQEKAQALTENDQECGEKWRGSFTKYDLDSSSWKTHQCSLLGDLEEFLETWPQWGLMRDGECWEQRTLEQTIRGTEFGLSEKWATPTTMDKLPPKSEKALMKEATQARPNRSKPANLRDQVSNMEKWPTPRSCSAMAATITPEAAWNEKRNPNLETIVGQRLWPTPTAHMAKETNAPSEHKRNTPTLTAQVNWPTPRTKGMCGGSGAWEQLKANTSIEEARSMVAGNGGKLNPTWVEWLMGWPLEWTDLKPLETDKCHFAPQQLGES
jgi:DNA (cytosine-5)-methyltransferase 1